MHALVRRAQQYYRDRSSSSSSSSRGTVLYLRVDNGGGSRPGVGAMNHIPAKKLKEIRQQMALHRRNLLCICKLAIRSFVEKAHSEGVDDSCEEFKNLATILEHILSHRLKGQISWFGLEEPREFWDFISASCSALPHNCIDNISNMEDAKKPKAKGRAWIRSALMEKRLAEYIQFALRDDRALKAFFGEGAFMRSEEATLLAMEMEKLNTIDFSSCLKGESLETGVAHVIDYGSYLQILLREDCPSSSSPSLVASDQGGNSDVGTGRDSDSANGPASDKYGRLQEQYRAVCAQKDYLEDMVQHKDHRLSKSQTECKHLQQALRHTDIMARQEHQQLQKKIIQLQAKVTELEEARQLARISLEQHLIAGQWSPPVSVAAAAGTMAAAPLQVQTESISLENLVITLPQGLPSPDSESVQSSEPSIGNPQPDSPGLSTSGTYVRSDSDRDMAAGQRSAQKDEETQSLIPLAGSFTSQMSIRSTETSSSGMLDSDTHTPYIYRVRPMSPGSTSSDSCISADVNHPLVVS